MASNCQKTSSGFRWVGACDKSPTKTATGAGKDCPSARNDFLDYCNSLGGSVKSKKTPIDLSFLKSRFKGTGSRTLPAKTKSPRAGSEGTGGGIGGAPSFLSPEMMDTLSLGGKIPWFTIPVAIAIGVVLLLVSKR